MTERLPAGLDHYFCIRCEGFYVLPDSYQHEWCPDCFNELNPVWHCRCQDCAAYANIQIVNAELLKEVND